MAIRLITPPTVEPVSLARAKQHLRVVDSDEDDLINTFISAARRHAEEFLGRALVTQTWELVIDEFPDEEIRIPKPPLQAIVSIKYDDATGVEQTMLAADYDVDTASEHGWVVPVDDWPATIEAINAVRIQFNAGYAPTADSPLDLTSGIPNDIICGMLLHLGSLYSHRETVVVGQTAVSLPWGAEQLLRMHRIDLSMA